MNQSDELAKIIKLRKSVFALDIQIIIIILLAIGVQFFSPILAPILGIIAFVLFYKKLKKAAHTPCPNCGEPFGTISKWPLGVGTNECQNCKLSLHENKKL